MGDKNNFVNHYEKILISIASEVVDKTEGVFSIANVDASKLTKRALKNNGVEVFFSGDDVTFEISIIVDNDRKVPDVAFFIQEKIKKEVEVATTFKVKSVNIRVSGVSFREGIM